MNSPALHAPDEELTRLRGQIDSLDQQLVEVLAKRFRVTEAVSALKAAHGLSAADPDRESKQEARLQKLAVEHMVNPQVVTSIFRSVVEEVVSNHKAYAAQRTSHQLKS